MKTLFAALLLMAASATAAAPLTVAASESWVFSIYKGEPANPRKVAANARPGKGQVLVSVRRLMGTSMFVTNNSGAAWVFRAELLKGGKAVAAKSCTLPAARGPLLEQWQQQADAVRISQFKPALKDGSCP